MIRLRVLRALRGCPLFLCASASLRESPQKQCPAASAVCRLNSVLRPFPPSLFFRFLRALRGWPPPPLREISSLAQKPGLKSPRKSGIKYVPLCTHAANQKAATFSWGDSCTVAPGPAVQLTAQHAVHMPPTKKRQSLPVYPFINHHSSFPIHSPTCIGHHSSSRGFAPRTQIPTFHFQSKASPQPMNTTALTIKPVAVTVAKKVQVRCKTSARATPKHAGGTEDWKFDQLWTN